MAFKVKNFRHDQNDLLSKLYDKYYILQIITVKKFYLNVWRYRGCFLSDRGGLELGSPWQLLTYSWCNVKIQIVSCCWNTVVPPLAGWNVPSRAPTSASSSILCALQARRNTPLRPWPIPPPLGGAREAIPWTENVTAAGHLSEITRAKGGTLIINTIRGTAVITKIRGGTETEKGVTGTKTTESGDMGGTCAAKPKTE